MGFWSNLFGSGEPAAETPAILPESKESKDLLWDKISSTLSILDNELRPIMVQAQQKKWVRATVSDFRNFTIKLRDGRTRAEKETAKIEAVPLQNPEFQDCAKTVGYFLKRINGEIKLVEEQLNGERNITQIPAHLSEGLSALEQLKGYWTNARKKFLE